MRYGPIPDNAVEELVLQSPRAPRALFDTFVPLVQASALIAAVRLGVFEGLRDAPRTAAELAGALALDTESLQLLMCVLETSSYLVGCDHGRFGLTELARTSLLEDSADSLTAWVAMIDIWWPRFAQMSDVLRTGKGYDLHDGLRNAGEWSTYQSAMLENARRMAPNVASRVPVRLGATRLLDIAGSHGLFGGLVARAHPPMRSEVLDLPQAVEHARKLASAEGLDDVVSYRPGDALTDDLGTGYDVVFLGNVLHHFTQAQIARLLARVRAAVRPDGTVAIYDTRQPDDGDGRDAIGDAFALFFRLTSSARCYTVREYQGWLAGAGFVDLQVQSLPVGSVLLTGRAPR